MLQRLSIRIVKLFFNEAYLLQFNCKLQFLKGQKLTVNNLVLDQFSLVIVIHYLINSSNDNSNDNNNGNDKNVLFDLIAYQKSQ